MFNPFKLLQKKLSKPLLFGIYGALGCLLAAILLGEFFLSYTKLPPSIQLTNQAIVLLIDSSSSMSGGKLDEVKAAAVSFVQRRDLSQDRLAVVSFGETIDTTSPLTSDAKRLETAINSLSETGGTPMAEGIETAIAVLQNTSLTRNILLFTDGQPNSSLQASLAAQKARNQRINLVAVATGDADINYLASLTEDPNLVFPASSGQFDRAFREAEKAIYGKQLVESGETGDYSLAQATLRIGGWTALLTLGISLSLILGQNAYLRRRLLSLREAGTIVAGSLAAGLLAGGSGQLIFLGIASLPNPGAISGIINWTIAGALIAAILSSWQRHLKTVPTILAGAIGAALSATLVFYLVQTMGDLALLIGAALFGIFMGYLSRSKFIGGALAIGSFFLGQWLFFPVSGLPPTLEVIGRIVGWTILGALVGGGITFVPNLKLQRALFGGSLGGILGAVGFLLASSLVADIPGRLVGAAILGFCLGMMIFWEEAKQLQTEAHLLVHWTPTEQTKILLGSRPIILGTSPEAQIPLSKAGGYFPLTAKIFQEGDTIIMEYDLEYGQAKGMKKLRQELRDGDRRQLGQINLEVKTSS